MLDGLDVSKTTGTDFSSDLAHALQEARGGAGSAEGGGPAKDSGVWPPVSQLGPDRTLVDGAGTLPRLQRGSVLADRYEVLAHVGRGATSDVYRVMDRTRGEQCALKLFVPRPGKDTKRQRFLEEVRLVAALEHPNIVRLFESGQEGEVPFFTMEFLEGIDLREFLELSPGAPLDAAVVVRLATGVARALEASHAAGVVHRDVKPANIQIVPGAEHVKLVDFGIAKAQDSALSLTSPDLIVGTPAYVSPERILTSDPALPSSDLYSLGVVMFECLTGERPFESPVVSTLLTRIARERAPKLYSRRPDLPLELCSAVDRLLVREPERRTPSATALLRDLREAEASLSRRP